MKNTEDKNNEQTIINDGVSGVNKHSTPAQDSGFGLVSYLIAIAVLILAALTFYWVSCHGTR